jgi:hypothetical protein
MAWHILKMSSESHNRRSQLGMTQQRTIDSSIIHENSQALPDRIQAASNVNPIPSIMPAFPTLNNQSETHTHSDKHSITSADRQTNVNHTGPSHNPDIQIPADVPIQPIVNFNYSEDGFNYRSPSFASHTYSDPPGNQQHHTSPGTKPTAYNPHRPPDNKTNLPFGDLLLAHKPPDSIRFYFNNLNGICPYNDWHRWRSGNKTLFGVAETYIDWKGPT